jgi:8-oxo-dGTP diphosphatase
VIPPEELRLQLTVDLAILTVRDGDLSVLVVERGNEPYRGQAALPGGFLRPGESLLDAALRELADQANLDGRDLHLEQLSVYGDPERDPRGRIVSVPYLAIAPGLPGEAEAAGARWAPVSEMEGILAFDHTAILRDAVERARSLLQFTTLAAAFCPDEFTIGDLRGVYEAVWNTTLDPRNFNRKISSTAGFVQPTGGRRAPDSGRPANLYRRGPAKWLSPPLMRA